MQWLTPQMKPDIKKFVDLLFYAERIDFVSSPWLLKGPHLDNVFSAAAKFLKKKQVKIEFFRALFGKFWRALSWKIGIYWCHRRL